MRLVHERRRDDQSWLLDWLVKNSGRVQNFAYDERDVPPEVKSYAMVPKHMGRQGMHREAIARAAEEAGHHDTALESYWRAVNSYHIAQHAIYYDDHPGKLRWYGRLRECYDRIIALSDYPMELVEVPWEGTQIQCVLHLLPDRRKAPTILFLPGMDMVKERFPDPRAASAVVDYLVSRPEVDSERIGLCGVSMGSFWGVRTAAYDHRIKALATGASCSKMAVLPPKQDAPRFKRIFMYMAGIHDEEEFDQTVAAHMTTAGYGSMITCPTLMVQGEYDPLCPLEDAEELFEEVQAPKELWILEDDFHSLYRHPGFGGMDSAPLMMDWVGDVLERGLPAGHSRVKRVTPKGGAGPYDEA